ncbi:Amino acid/polyamine transporter I [Cordyceps fumosorosea ARSEF 2679]|uniref:Amino acid/polyamine transporter I n=1 Tax=Cordyceps fumosorosea (strain ARSEF 2679) TaxID=1081104 RepID=A0A168CJY3_CORFA|nr:Amino acid/polyamine transporter I [Cordyceps fumosorosea ARSEF 2679]OAA71470.1 Amino acid/polyamine transporter I [Cordyceps fumosorosea ARSEF 2679]
MTAKTSDERRPLLPDASERRAPYTAGNDTEDALIPHKDASLPSRSVDDDVLPETSTLGRTLGRRSAYILVMSRIIGSGIFATPGAVLAGVGSPGLALLLWFVGAALSAAGLAVALEYGCALPRSGGHKVYLEYTFRRPRFLASTLVAANAVLLGFTASNCVVFSEYVLYAAGRRGEREEVLRKGVAVGMLTLVTAIHLLTPRFGVRLQDGLGWVKMGIVVFMILCGLYVVAFRPDTAAGGLPVSGESWERLWRDSNWNWGILCTALFKVLYSYSGLDNVTNVLNEVKDPVRTLRVVSRAALLTACVMYLLINVAYLVVVPVDEIKGSGELIAALFFQRIFGARLGGQVLPLLVALSAFGNVLVVVFALSRLKHEIARQGFLPFSDFLSSTKPFNSPFGGLLVNYIPSVLIIVLPPSGKIYSFILEVEGYGGQITGLGIAIGLLWLRHKQPDLRRPYKASSLAVGAKLVLSVALLVAPFVPPKDRYPGGLFYATYAIAGISTFVISVVYWYVWTVLLPKWRGYSLEEEEATLADGTTITKLVHKPLQ